LVIQNSLTSYKSRYSNDKSFDFIIPLMVLLFLGVIYILSLRSSQGFVSFILIGVTAAIMIYWVRVLKKMTKESQPQYTAKEVDTKNWVYDLIKGDKEIVFVAEVPGPEDQVTVRLIDGILYIRGSAHFSKEVPIEATPDMGIHDFKYRNGVLTLRIKKLETL
jgi:HSP20 family protein